MSGVRQAVDASQTTTVAMPKRKPARSTTP